MVVRADIRDQAAAGRVTLTGEPSPPFGVRGVLISPSGGRRCDAEADLRPTPSADIIG